MLHLLRSQLFVATLAVLTAATPLLANDSGALFTPQSHATEPVVETSARSGESTASTILTDPLSDQTNTQANVVVACQGCRQTGADAFPAFNFVLDHVSLEDCAVAFSINRSASQLSQTHPQSSISVGPVERPLYRLRTTLSCKSETLDHLPVYLPVISVSIESAEEVALAEESGFAVAVDLSGHISAVTLLSQTRIHSASVTPPIVSAEKSVLELLHQVDTLRKSLLDDSKNTSVRSGLDSSSSFEAPADLQSGTETCTVTRCIDHLRSSVKCAARHASQGVGESVLSVLDHFQDSIGADRTTRFKDQVQAVMKTMDDRLDCSMHKHEKEPIKVTVTEVHEEAPLNVVPQPDHSTVPKSLIQALEVLVAALGLGGLLAFLKRRYCSLRRRVERLADREERIKAREYRRAARQEARRRRWANFKQTFTSCFKGASQDDEEKHALILNAAEEGRADEVKDDLRAHMRGLRYAHDVTVQMTIAGHFTALGHDLHSFPSNFYRPNVGSSTSHEGRSRASSLPSYNSEVLPDYSSQPDGDTLYSSIRVMDGMRRSASPSSMVSSSRCTPDSSIPDISPRPSIETLRTQGTD